MIFTKLMLAQQGGGGGGIELPPNDEIWYFADAQQTFYDNVVAGKDLVSHTFTDGKGVLKFSGSITQTTMYGFVDVYAESVYLPHSLENIAQYGFSSSSIKKYFFGNGLKTISPWAFEYAGDSLEISIQATTPPTLYSASFGNGGYPALIYVPRESLSAYQSAKYWADYADIMQGYDF